MTSRKTMPTLREPNEAKNHLRKKRNRAAHRCQTRRLLMEQLETRQVLATFNLTGAVLQLGINDNGSFGNGTRMAAYSGVEFYYPGTPYHEIAISADGLVRYNYAENGITQIPGSSTNTSSGTTLSARFSGSVLGLNIVRDLWFDNSSSLVNYSIQITNTTGSTINNVAFMDAGDPDQSTSLGFSPATYNDVVSIAGVNFVRAYSPGGSPLTVGFGSSDPRAVVSVEYPWPIHNPFAIISSPFDPNGALVDDAIGIAFNFGNLAPGQTVTATYASPLAATPSAADNLFLSTLMDFGDAPATYGTATASHIIIGPTLGTNRDTEGAPSTPLDGTGDDVTGTPDDEDGLVSLSPMAPSGSARAVVNVQGVTGTHYLNAWIDFDGNGVFGAGEQIATNLAVTTNGNQSVIFSVPGTAVPGASYARFRLSSASGLNATGAASDGEIEDYAVTIAAPPTPVYVDDTWLGTTPGTNPANDPIGGLVFGYNAFSDIPSALAVVATGGQVTVFGGTYSAAATINKTLASIDAATNSTVPAQTTVDISGAVTVDEHTLFRMLGATNLTFSSTVNAGADAPGETLTIAAVAPIADDGTLTFGGGGAGGSIALAAIAATAGVINLNAPLTATGNVTLTATNGAIVDGNAAAMNITAAAAALRAETGIGSSDPLETDVDTLAASNTTGGNIQVRNQDANASVTNGLLVIGTVGALAGVTNADPAYGGGTIWITNTSPVTVNSPVTDAAGGDITIAAEGGTGKALYGLQPGTQRVVEVNPSDGSIVSSFVPPVPISGSVSGLSGAEGGATLIYQDGFDPAGNVYRLDPMTGGVLSVETMGPGSAIGFRGGLSFQNDGATDYIYSINNGNAVERQTGFSGPFGPFVFVSPQFPGALGGDDNGRHYVLDFVNTIREFAPLTGAILNSFVSPSGNVSGLAFDGTDLFACDFLSGLLFTLNPNTGAVLNAVPVAGGSLVGLGVAWTTVASDPTDDLDVNANITASGGAGTIKLYAADTIDVDAAVTISAASTGDILLSASTDYNNGVPQNGYNGTDASLYGRVVMNDGSVVQSQDGNISIRGDGDVRLSLVNADSDGDGAAGDVIVTADYAGVGGGMSDNSGGISDNLSGEAPNIVGDQLALRAGSGIGSGVSGSTDIDTAVRTLAAVTGSGDINVMDVEWLTIAAFNSLSGLTITNADGTATGNDDITVVTRGDLTVATGNPIADSDGGDVTLSAEGGGHYQLISGSFLLPQALADAAARGGHVATIRSAVENAAVESVLGAVASAWIGASDSTTEGIWRWVNGPEAGIQFWSGLYSPLGSPVGGEYSNWNVGEPNNLGDEDGGHIFTGGRWNDNTGLVRPYILELPWADLTLNSPVTITGGTGAVTLQANRDVTGDAAGDMTTANGDVTITADLDNSSFAGPNANGTIQMDGDITAGTGTVTLSLSDCDGYLGSALNLATGQGTSANGSIISASQVIKNGSGALRLNGTANAYTGTTTVNAGALIVNGVMTADGGLITVQSGALLGGNGTIGATPGGRDIQVNAGGTLDVGDLLPSDCTIARPGQLTVNGDVTFAPGSTFRVQLNSLVAGVDADGTYLPDGYDQLVVNGDVDLSGDSLGAGGSLLDCSVGFGMPIGAEFVIIDNDGGNDIDTRFDGHPEGDFLTCGGYLGNISYYSGEDGDNQDVMLTAPGRFDFNGYSQTTAPNYLGVPETLVKTGMNTYGWDAPIDSFERPENYPPPHPTVDPLLWDGHFVQLTDVRTFQVAVVPNQTYQVQILTGDWVHPHDWQQFRVYDPGPGGASQTKIVSTQADVTEYTTVRFEVRVGASGLLSIEMQDRGDLALPGAETNPATVILGMDIRPINTVGEISLAALGTLDADGLTVDTYTGQNAPPNVMLTVRASNWNEYVVNDVTASNLGPIVTPDEEIYRTYTQVYSDAGGNFTFDLQRPTGTGPVFITVEPTPGAHVIPAVGTPADLGEDRFGLSRGTATQNYVLPSTRLLDFNSGFNQTATDYPNTLLPPENLQEDYVGVPVGQAYDLTTTNALGWNAAATTPTALPLADFDRGTSDALLRDGHYGYDSEFLIDLPAAGNYIVNTVIGDTSPFYHDRVEVYDEFALLTTLGPITTSAGQWTSSSFLVNVPDLTPPVPPQLHVRLRDAGGVDPHWVLNALRVRPAPAQLITISGPAGPLDANGTTVDVFTGSGAPANSLVTVATTLGMILTTGPAQPDEDLTLQGVQVLADGSGNFTFYIQRPSGTGNSMAPFTTTATITAQEVLGRNLGSTTRVYQPPVASFVRQFDFGASATYTQTGFTFVGPRDIYSGTRGYGWSTRVAAADRPSSGFSNLNRDLHTGSNATFYVQVGGGTFNIRVYLANPLGTGGYQYTYDNFEVRPEGGATHSVTLLTPNAITVANLTGSDLDGDGRLAIQFIDIGGGQNFNWVASGLQIWDTSSSDPGTISSLLADASGPALRGGATIDDARLAPLVAEAAARWSAVDLTPAQLTVLSDLHVGVSDLGGPTLGLAYSASNDIRIDDDAAGWGWSVARGQGSGGRGQEAGGRDQWDGVGGLFLNPEPRTLTPGLDLMHTLLHEIGHLLGYEHTDSGLMAPVLAASPLHPSSLILPPSSFRPDPPSGRDDVFADLGRDAGEDEALPWLASQAGEALLATAINQGDEAAQIRIPRRHRLERFEHDLDAWFAQLSAAEEPVTGDR